MTRPRLPLVGGRFPNSEASQATRVSPACQPCRTALLPAFTEANYLSCPLKPLHNVCLECFLQAGERIALGECAELEPLAGEEAPRVVQVGFALAKALHWDALLSWAGRAGRAGGGMVLLAWAGRGGHSPSHLRQQQFLARGPYSPGGFNLCR